MKKIIHMSDLHIGYRDYKKRFLQIITRLSDTLSKEPKNYIIVITGDLVHNANKAGSYEQAQACLIELKNTGFKHILLIPGNHDYGTGNKGSHKFVKLFQETFFGAVTDYPKLDIIDHIAFIGLDSMADELHWYDDMWAQGQLGKQQLLRLESLLSSDEVRDCEKRVIYLHHHPFKWRPLHQLKDSRKLKKILMNTMSEGVTIDALLFGHNHEGHAHNGKWGIARCYDAGTATLKSRPKCVRWASWFQVQSSTRIMDLYNDPEEDAVLALIKEKVKTTNDDC